MKNYSHHHDNGNVLDRSSMDIAPLITIILDEILIFVLFTRETSFGGIWSSGEDYMTLYMGGRQIFETSHEVHKRGG
jgi:hypothetical protein